MSELCSVGSGITEKVIKSDLSGWTSPEMPWESGNLRGPTRCLALRAVAGLLVVGNEWFLGSPRPFGEMNGFPGLHVPLLACWLRCAWFGSALWVERGAPPAAPGVSLVEVEPRAPSQCGPTPGGQSSQADRMLDLSN